jgi:hypothetical protein
VSTTAVTAAPIERMAGEVVDQVVDQVVVIPITSSMVSTARTSVRFPPDAAISALVFDR